MSRWVDDAAHAESVGAKREPKPVGEVLDTLMRSLGAPSAPAVAALFDQWPTVAGAALAASVRPIRLDADELVVVVGDPAWASQVRWHDTDLRRRCGEVCGVTPARTVVRVDPKRFADAAPTNQDL